jgi:putative flippase GtrA
VSRLLADTKMRFLLAGGSAALLNWLIRFPLSGVISYGAAVLVAMAIGMTYGFWIYRNWAFKSGGNRPLLLEIRDFLIVNVAGMVATLICSLLTLHLLLSAGSDQAIGEAIAHAVGIAMGAVINFLGHRFITFRPSEPGETRQA